MTHLTVISPLDVDTVLKWEIALVFVSCYVLFLLFAALGVRFNNLRSSYPQKILLMAFVFSAIKIIFCFTFFQWIENGLFIGQHMMHMVISLLWSPLMPMTVVWLYLAHSVKSCNDCSFRVPHRNVRTLPEPMRVFAFVMSGVCTTLLAYACEVLCPRTGTAIILLFTVTALLGCSLELIYFKARDNVVRMASPTWCWFCGTWIGSVILFLL